jgi:multidrug resistance efflux pump
MKLIRKKKLWGIALVAVLTLGAVAIMVLRPQASVVTASEGTDMDDEESPSADAVDVKTIHPLNNLPIVITVQEPADVLPFYRTDLSSQVAGIVTRMPKGLNDTVQKGELLAKIDAPDRVAELAEKESAIERCERELDETRARAKAAARACNVARAYVKLKTSLVGVAEKEINWRWADLTRYRGLAKDHVITEDLVDEKEKFYLVSLVNRVAAVADEEKAKEDLQEVIAKEEAAVADIKLKQVLIQVARKDRDRAQALLDYATIRAPFDGVIVRRNADPGDFVQNASNARSEPLIAVARTDIMTVVMKLPDTYASYVTLDTDAIIHVQGRRIKAKVTRFARSIHPQDRTMRVEVDIFNGTREEYDRFVLKAASAFLPSFGIPRPVDALGRLVAGRLTWDDNSKGIMDPLPVLPDASSGKFRGPAERLLPGMYGQMKLLLKNFQSDYLVPSKAIFSVGGTKYICLVKDGRAHRQAVDVEMNDGTVAKVLLLVSKSPDGTEPEEVEEMKGHEEIIMPRGNIVNSQAEIGDGQLVRVQPMSWPTVKKAGP